MPRVFIGIPTLNRPEFVRQTIRSVREQTFGDWRILLSDNASTPEASADVQAHVASLADPRIGYWRQPKNIREYGNCAWLFGQCREEFFVILHDDDELAPDHLRRALQRLDADPAPVAFCSQADLIDAHGVVSPDRTAAYARDRGRVDQPEGPMPLLEPLMRTGFVPISGTVIRHAALARAGFVDDDCFGLWPFELNMLMRLGERGEAVWFETEPLVRYRFHGGQMQRYQGIAGDVVALGMVQRILERRRFRGEAEQLRRRLLSMFCHLHARAAVRRDDLAACRRLLRRAIQVNPWWLRHWPMAVCAFLAPPLTAPLVRLIDARPPREL